MSRIRAVATTASPGPLAPRIATRITRGLATMQLAIDAIDGQVFIETGDDGMQLELRFGFDSHRKEAVEIADALVLGIALRSGVPDWPWDVTVSEVEAGVPGTTMTAAGVADAVGVDESLLPTVLALPTFPRPVATVDGRVWDSDAVLRHPLCVTRASA